MDGGGELDAVFVSPVALTILGLSTTPQAMSVKVHGIAYGNFETTHNLCNTIQISLLYNTTVQVNLNHVVVRHVNYVLGTHTFCTPNINRICALANPIAWGVTTVDIGNKLLNPTLQIAQVNWISMPIV